MHLLRLHTLTRGPDRARLDGDRGSVLVESPAPGVLRLRISPAQRIADDKRSFAVVSSSPGPLLVEERGAHVTVAADELRAELALDPFAFTIDYAGQRLVRAVAIDGDRREAYPMAAHHAAIALEAPPGEAYLGFGEKVGPLDKRGLRFSFWNTDVMPHHPDTDPLYLSIPFFIGVRDGVAYGCFLDETHRSDIDVAHTERDRIHVRSHGPELDLYVIAGPRIADVIARYVTLTGRPALPPLWALGAQQSRWSYENEAAVRGVIAAARDAGFPLDVVYLDIDHMDRYRVFTVDRARFPDLPRLADDARREGVRLVPIVDPGLKAEPGWELYDEARARDLLVRHDRGDVLLGEVWPKPAAFPDFTRDEVRALWASKQRALVEQGVAGLWIDMNEPSCFSVEAGARLEPGHIEVLHERDDPKTLPLDAVHGALRHREVHNVYGLEMARATFDGLRDARPDARPFVLSRAGFAGIQRYAAVWTGDNSAYWEHLELSITMLLGLSLSGVPFCGADIPGFLGAPSPELAVRWAQLGAFYPLSRHHAAKGTPYKEPWRLFEPFRSAARDALRLRYRLLPTLYTLFFESHRTGLPVVRPLAMDHPDDARALAADDQLMLGRDLLIAPVTRPRRDERLVYLPRGRFMAWPSLDEPGDVVEGGRSVIARAPLDTVPIWLREGGVVTLTTPALHTTTAAWSALEWHVHAGSNIEGALYEDAGDGYGAHRLTRIRGARDGDAVVLERTVEGDLEVTRASETLHVYTDGARRSLDVAPDWRRVVVEL